MFVPICLYINSMILFTQQYITGHAKMAPAAAAGRR